MSRDEMEARRLAAGHDLLYGATTAQILEKYSVSRTTLMRWRQKINKAPGTTGLRKTVTTGRPPRLKPHQVAQVRQWCYNIPQYTYQEIRDQIEKNFGICYNRDSVGRILWQMGLQSGRSRAKRKA
jgi:transposase